MKGRLQFKHDFSIYKDKAEIEQYLDAIISRYLITQDEGLKKFIPILGEPVIFRYKNSGETAPHLVLGMGVTQSLEPETECDTPLDEDIYPKYVLVDLDAVSNGSEKIENVINGLGFTDEGVFDAINGKYFNGEDATVANYIKILHDNVANLELVYDSESKRILLKDASGEPISEGIDASIFIKDGLLEGVRMINSEEERERYDLDAVERDDHTQMPYLLIEWNTDADKDYRFSRISLKDFFDPYKGYSGITVDGFNISIKLDESDEFLSVSDNGLKTIGIQDAIDAAVTESNSYADAIAEDFAGAVMDLNSAITTNSEKIQENKVSIEKLKDFAEYQVGSIEGEVISTVVKSNRDRIEDLESKVNDPDGGLDNKVDKVEGKGLSTNDYTNEEKALLATLSENAQENVIEVVKVNGVALDVNQDKAVNVEVPFTSLSNNEKILTLNNGVVESVLSANYDREAKTIYLKGKNNIVISEIPVSDFVVDGMIRSVSIVTENGVRYMKFIFNTDAGGREIMVPLTDLVTEYTVSGGSENYLTIDNFKIGLKVDQPDYSGLASGSAVHDLDDKYSAITHSLEDKVGEGILDDSGNTISLTHKVNELDDAMTNFVDENKLEFDEDFKIAGIVGTLGTGKWKNGDVIPAGTKVMDVLKDILQQRLLPEGVAPTATIKLVNPSPVEVGSVISPVYEIKFNNGVYNYADGTTGATLISVDSASVILLNNGSNTPNTSTAYPNGTFQNVVATDGMNLSVMANISYSGTYIPKDNLGADVPENKIPDGMLEFVRSDNTITSYRPMFYGSLRDGDIADYDNITSAEVLSLLSKATGETVDRVVVDDEAEVVVIMIPVMSNKEVKKIIDTDSGFDLMDVFERHQTVVKTYNGEESATTSYYAYVYDPKTQIGANVYRIIYS